MRHSFKFLSCREEPGVALQAAPMTSWGLGQSPLVPVCCNEKLQLRPLLIPNNIVLTYWSPLTKAQCANPFLCCLGRNCNPYCFSRARVEYGNVACLRGKEGIAINSALLFTVDLIGTRGILLSVCWDCRKHLRSCMRHPGGAIEETDGR